MDRHKFYIRNRSGQNIVTYKVDISDGPGPYDLPKSRSLPDVTSPAAGAAPPSGPPFGTRNGPTLLPRVTNVPGLTPTNQHPRRVIP